MEQKLIDRFYVYGPNEMTNSVAGLVSVGLWNAMFNQYYF